MSRLLALLTNTVFLWILLGAVVLVGLTCHHKTTSAIRAETQRELDALKAERPAFLRTIDSLKTSSAAATIHATTTVTQARTTLAASAVSRRLADSLAKIAAATDSAELAALEWRKAYVARTDEADSLRKVAAQLDSAQAERERARAFLADALAQSEARRERSEAVNVQLQAVIAKQAKGCRVLWIVKCPSRAASFAAGAVTGAVIAYTIKP